MKKIVAELKKKSVLKHEDIIRIKKYIEEKYSHVDNRAAILANAIHRILDSQLPSFAEKTRISSERKF